MVSGLFVPVIAGIFIKNRSNLGAFWSMIVGGTVTLGLIVSSIELPFKLDANIYGITLAAITYLFFHISKKNQKQEQYKLA
jgi:SSS family solute:Na+ symporter